MFKCEISKIQVQPNVKPIRIVTEKRRVVYMRKVQDEETKEWATVLVSRGWEIVKEVMVSATGLRMWQEMHEPVKLHTENPKMVMIQ